MFSLKDLLRSGYEITLVNIYESCLEEEWKA